MRLHDFFEAKKKMSAKDDPCWDGYHMVGTKQKDGREVPNCVPGKKGVSEVKGESPESELERLKMRQDAEHGSAPLRRQAATQARIRELEKQIKNKKQGVAEGFKNTYEVNDRVETPMGSGTIVAVSPNINVDGKIRVKLDDPSRAGEDGKHKDTFTLTTMQVKHMATSESDMSGIMHAARHYNKSFIITADVAEGGRKKYRVRAQSERVAREKFAKHYSMAKIVDVKEEN